MRISEIAAPPLARASGLTLSNPDQIALEMLAADVFRQPALQAAVATLEELALAYPQACLKDGSSTGRLIVAGRRRQHSAESRARFHALY